MKNSKPITQEEGNISAGKSTLIYDAACPVCVQTIAWVRGNAEKTSLEMLPCQSGDLGARFPAIEREACMQALHLVLPDGRKYIGEEALPLILEKMKRYRWMAILFKLPGALFVCRIFYKLVAGTRYHISDFLHLTLPKKNNGKSRTMAS